MCHEQNLLVYHPVLSVMDNNGWYFSQIFYGRGHKLVGISTGFVCCGQKWLVYQPVLSVVDNIGWYISRMCLAWTILVGKSTGFVFHGQ